MRKYRISNNELVEVGSKGQKVFRIADVTPAGIKVLDEADNGVEILRLIKWDNIKR